ncbi:Imm9 family immunity protein [Paenibacillus sp. MZ04-78.2]|uniref:Imm9 family immunity protein n=1 Tax=Paenibacillus sp. MZ04-78.2 TaxID=2962034 RepID=UPI0020B78FE0|nr:Imm9 family immunity protein [Paenibacillus sp. MZ04-78.2]MCP3772190.1 Imm9 family immunity protein [Paenibacillus sp. MZ04-78.2]
MKFKLSYRSNIMYNELIQFDYEKISVDFDILVTSFDQRMLQDWTVSIHILYDSAERTRNCICIAKRGVTYSPNKEKELSIIIPFPKSNEIDWGLPKKCFVTGVPHIEEKYFHFIEVDFTSFKNIENYVQFAISKGLQELFEIGFTLKGKKVRLENENR